MLEGARGGGVGDAEEQTILLPLPFAEASGNVLFVLSSDSNFVARDAVPLSGRGVGTL